MRRQLGSLDSNAVATELFPDATSPDNVIARYFIMGSAALYDMILKKKIYLTAMIYRKSTLTEFQHLHIHFFHANACFGGLILHLALLYRFIRSE